MLQPAKVATPAAAVTVVLVHRSTYRYQEFVPVARVIESVAPVPLVTTFPFESSMLTLGCDVHVAAATPPWVAS